MELSNQGASVLSLSLFRGQWTSLSPELFLHWGVPPLEVSSPSAVAFYLQVLLIFHYLSVFPHLPLHSGLSPYTSLCLSPNSSCPFLSTSYLFILLFSDIIRSIFIRTQSFLLVRWGDQWWVRAQWDRLSFSLSWPGTHWVADTGFGILIHCLHLLNCRFIEMCLQLQLTVFLIKWNGRYIKRELICIFK